MLSAVGAGAVLGTSVSAVLSVAGRSTCSGDAIRASFLGDAIFLASLLGRVSGDAINLASFLGRPRLFSVGGGVGVSDVCEKCELSGKLGE